jgi:hypothetical protein
MDRINVINLFQDLRKSHKNIKNFNMLKRYEISLSNFKNDAEIKKKYKIDLNVDRIIYLISFLSNDIYFIKIGFTDTNIYKRLMQISRDLKKLNQNIQLNILYCSKLTGTYHAEKNIHKVCKKYEFTTMNDLLKYNNIEKEVTGKNEMYLIENDKQMKTIILLYFIEIENIHHNDSIIGKAINWFKKMIFPVI